MTQLLPPMSSPSRGGDGQKKEKLQSDRGDTKGGGTYSALTKEFTKSFKKELEDPLS